MFKFILFMAPLVMGLPLNAKDLSAAKKAIQTYQNAKENSDMQQVQLSLTTCKFKQNKKKRSCVSRPAQKALKTALQRGVDHSVRILAEVSKPAAEKGIAYLYAADAQDEYTVHVFTPSTKQTKTTKGKQNENMLLFGSEVQVSDLQRFDFSMFEIEGVETKQGESENLILFKNKQNKKEQVEVEFAKGHDSIKSLKFLKSGAVTREVRYTRENDSGFLKSIVVSNFKNERMTLLKFSNRSRVKEKSDVFTKATLSNRSLRIKALSGSKS